MHTCVQVRYRALLDVFFSRVDPTTLNRQGNDRGTQYRSVIFTHDEQQAAEAAAKVAELNEQLGSVSGRCRAAACTHLCHVLS